MWDAGLGAGRAADAHRHAPECAAARRALPLGDRPAYRLHDTRRIRKHVPRQAFADAGNARQQALRGTYDPGYLAYTLGKLMIRKLRADWLAANPGATPQQFHDRFLSYGAPPCPWRGANCSATTPPL